jgi:hypothetical protein
LPSYELLKRERTGQLVEPLNFFAETRFAETLRSLAFAETRFCETATRVAYRFAECFLLKHQCLGRRVTVIDFESQKHI